MWSGLSKVKKVFIEPKAKAELKLVLLQFREAVCEENGSVLFAVCRGKVCIESIWVLDYHIRSHLFFLELPCVVLSQNGNLFGIEISAVLLKTCFFSIGKRGN